MSDGVVGPAIEGGLTVLKELIAMRERAAAEGRPDPTMSALIEAMPAEAFKISQQIEAQLRELRQNLISNEIDLTQTADDILSSHWFWEHRFDRTPRRINELLEGLKNSLTVMADDFVAIARCSGQNELIGLSYSDSRETKSQLRQMTNPDRPVGEILNDLIDFTEQVSAQLGNIAR
ncbi:MAG: hypothetical protein RIA64_08835 [Rhodospirillales bacterium]